ncbi:choice-of-anchor J domain-containing protein [Rossellomorea marisflavi]|uniref:choice-of-anchor J domain-containing protein n=1 Tax=Rossellomorea marisflavi TaxID=189381 RepID=UPI003F53D691
MYLKTKLFSILSTGALALGLLAPFSQEVSAESTPTKANWNTERYGDRIDIDGHLESLSENENFLNKAEGKLKKQVKEFKFDQKGEVKAQSNKQTSEFTYDGGTKLFLDRDLEFKQFTLRSVGDNVEIWVANDLAFPEGDPRPPHVVTQEQVDKLKDEFDSNIYPTATDFFGMPDELDGSNATVPGMVGLPDNYYEGSDKVIMLVDNIKDDGYYDPSYPFFVAGFFWQTLENYTDRNIITIDTNSWETRLENTFFGTTIHELQHLIHADNDPAEETWLNEGMSTFSEFLGGYGSNEGSVNFYLDHPENSLVNWDEHRSAATGPETIADYGQVYLFTLYMYDKYGQEFIRDLATDETHGIESVDHMLKEYGAKEDFTTLYQHFITALAIDDGSGGKYDFDSIDLRDLTVDSKGTKRGMTVDYEKALEYEKEGVPAWGGDFKELDFKGKVDTINFDGVDFLPVKWKSVDDPKGSGNKVLWANEGDELDSAIVLEADLSKVDKATLSFDNFIDIEEAWDYAMVQVSEDNGQTWTSLENENTRSDVDGQGYPKIKDNVPGFTGHYEDWQKETFDLSQYAGKDILISFRYLTDWGYNDSGWFIDNIEIPEIGFEQDGSNLDVFKSKAEILGEYVEYTVTFINERQVGNKKNPKTKYKVIQVDPFNVTETNALKLRQLFKDGSNYMITSYAAPPHDKNPVDFTYEVKLKDKKKPKKKH